MRRGIPVRYSDNVRAVGHGLSAPLAELVDAADLKSAAARHAGSIPAGGTILTLYRGERISRTSWTNSAVHHMFTTNSTGDHGGEGPAEAGLSLGSGSVVEMLDRLHRSQMIERSVWLSWSNVATRDCLDLLGFDGLRDG